MPTLIVPMEFRRTTLKFWGKSICCDHFTVQSTAASILQLQGDWRRQMCGLLASCQREDGSFFNGRIRLMKENDFLLCAIFAVMALRIAYSR